MIELNDGGVNFMMESSIYAPLWIMYPNIPNGSIGWRMGYGESYAMEQYRWFSKLSDEEKREYTEKFPMPKVWERREANIFRKDKYWTLKWNKDGKPEYGLDDLISDYNKNKNIDFLFFWGHHNNNSEITKSCFSQWYPSEFHIGINKYLFMEQYMMAEKARLFGDSEIEEKIMNSTNQKEIKALGRKVRNFDEDVWNEVKYSIVLNGNYYKFMQNERLRQFLLSTKDEVLGEASPYDTIWGIGMSESFENVDNPLKWQGQNLLGFALMEVRNEIRRVCENIGMIDFKSLHDKFD